MQHIQSTSHMNETCHIQLSHVTCEFMRARAQSEQQEKQLNAKA